MACVGSLDTDTQDYNLHGETGDMGSVCHQYYTGEVLNTF